MSDELKRIGEMFRTKREEMNLSLKEIENATSIRQTYLQAIEEGHISQFLSPVYALGFVRQYATFLEIDGEKLIQDHPEAFKMPRQQQEFSYGIGTLESRGNPTGGVRSIPQLVWGAVGVGVLIAAWYFAKLVGVL